MQEFLQAYSLEAVAALVAAIAALTILDDAIASFVRRIPIAGPLLAPLARRLSARFREWMRTQVPRSAEAAVAEAEGKLGPGTGATKKRLAVDVLNAKEPGLSRGEMDAEIEAAFARMIGAAALERPKPAAPPPVAAH